MTTTEAPRVLLLTTWRTALAALMAALFAPAPFASAAATHRAGRLIASKEPGWPQWRGPRRDGVSDETDLLQSWPEGGPKLLWSASGLGRGYSSPIVARGTLYITGDVGRELHIFAFDLEGKLKWRVTNGRHWQRPVPGSRACCAYAAGRLFHANAHGRVACLDPADGKELWAVNILERFGGKNITWGISECLLVDGPRVIVTPGGRKGLMAALDRETGRTLWVSQPVAGESAGYSSPILFELAGRRHLVSCSEHNAFGVDADTGKLLWTHRMPRRLEMVTSPPLFHDGAILAAATDRVGGVLLRLQLRVEGDEVRVRRAWTSPVDTMHGGGVVVDGLLYGAGHRGKRGWACVDLRDGSPRYQMTDLAPGSVLYADHRLYCLSEQGEMALLKPTPTGFQTVGGFRLVQGKKKDAWTHPVICDGRLYLRYHDKLFCYDIKKK